MVVGKQAGTFCFFDFPISDLYGSNLGIVGDGVLGREVARIGEALGMNVSFAAHEGPLDERLPYKALDDVLEHSDVISIHCPLLPSTRNLIGATEFAKMQLRPLLINTARGGIVDESALIVALRSGQVSGTGFDVLTQGPPGVDHPFQELTNFPNFIATPHVAWASDQALTAYVDAIADNIECFAMGASHNLVTA